MIDVIDFVKTFLSQTLHKMYYIVVYIVILIWIIHIMMEDLVHIVQPYQGPWY